MEETLSDATVLSDALGCNSLLERSMDTIVRLHPNGGTSLVL